jgi:hypothetical protein
VTKGVRLSKTWTSGSPCHQPVLLGQRLVGIHPRCLVDELLFGWVHRQDVKEFLDVRSLLKHLLLAPPLPGLHVGGRVVVRQGCLVAAATTAAAAVAAAATATAAATGFLGHLLQLLRVAVENGPVHRAQQMLLATSRDAI